jgi:hypothetical protein
MSEPSYGEPDGFSFPPGIEFVQDNGGPSLTEPTLDFEDSPSLVWSVVDDPLNQRIKVRAATTSDLLDLSVAATVAGKIEVTSTNPDLPTGIVDSSTLTFDGTQKVQIIFAAAGIDIDQRGIANPGGAHFRLQRLRRLLRRDRLLHRRHPHPDRRRPHLLDQGLQTGIGRHRRRQLVRLRRQPRHAARNPAGLHRSCQLLGARRRRPHRRRRRVRLDAPRRADRVPPRHRRQLDRSQPDLGRG